MTCEQVLAELEKMGNETTKRIFQTHGAPEPLYGVKVGDLKTLPEKDKKDHQLSLQLYQSGNSDAQYLAGLIADENKITKHDLQQWVQNAKWYMLSEYTVPWIAAESAFGYELALEWIKDEKEGIQAAGWATLASVVAIKKDDELEMEHLRYLLKYVEKNITAATNRVRYAMNGFVISAGCYVKELTPDALATANRIGIVTVEMNGTSCKVPYAPDYIQKVIDKGTVGKKKKMARC